MDAEEFLMEGMKISRQIKNKKYEIEELRSMMQNVSIPLDRENVSGTRNTKGFEGTMLKMIDKEQELEGMIQDLLEKRSKITSVIETVKNPQEYDVLHQTYVQEKAVKEIAFELNYSMTYIRKLKKNGIQSVQNILDSSF